MTFKEYLKNSGKSENTISSYEYAVNLFFELYGSCTEDNLLAFKSRLIDDYSPRTVNLRISAINAYLQYAGFSIRISTVKYQQQTFIENVISFADYEYLKNSL